MPIASNQDVEEALDTLQALQGALPADSSQASHLNDTAAEQQAVLPPQQTDGTASTAETAVPDASETGSDHPSNGEERGNKDDDFELRGLALSSRITELGYSVDTIATLIFEIQELRHATVSHPKDAAPSSAQARPDSSELSRVSEVDAALMRLDEQVEVASVEANSLGESIQTFCRDHSAGFIQAKWEDAYKRWQDAQRDAESLRQELVEDKYLTVYRTVSKQADDMMQSLEKVFAQCQGFVHDMHRIYGKSGAPSFPNDNDKNAPPTSLDPEHLNAFVTLHKSLHQKSKYYVPSCERVLRVIESGIAQQKSLNGEVLHSHADMKSRWRNLKERLKRTESEMQSVQDLLSELAESQSAISSASSRAGGQPYQTKEKRSAHSKNRTTAVTPSKNARKSSDWLSPSPARSDTSNSKSDPPSPSTSLSQRAVSPFRKIAHRLKSNSQSSNGSRETVPPVPPISASHSQHASQGSESVDRSTASDATQSRSSSPLTSLRPNNVQASPSIDSRPRWNASTRIQDEPDCNTVSKHRMSMSLGQHHQDSSRGSLNTNQVVQNRSGRMTPSSHQQSRNFTAPNPPFASPRRPTSPTLSTTTSSSHSPLKPRPSSPNSRIPAPMTASTSSAIRPGARARPSLAPSSNDGAEDAQETLFFGQSMIGRHGKDDMPSSLMQRALSPTPSTGAQTVASSINGGPPSSAARRQSHIPRLSVSGTSASNTPMTSPALSNSVNNRFDFTRDLMTPEPTLRSRAARASAMYGGNGSGLGTPGRPSSRMSFGMPSPALSNSGYFGLRSHKGSAGSEGSGMRPYSPAPSGFGTPNGRQSALGSRTPAHLAATPYHHQQDGGPYRPNQIDPLDVEISRIVNAQPLYVRCQRLDLPLNKAEAAIQKPTDRIANYAFGFSDRPVTCKLVERGPQRERKVLAKVGGGWQDLTVLLLNFQAAY